MVKISGYGLVGDVGGTHVRLGLCPVGGRHVDEENLIAVETLKGVDYVSMEEAMRVYLSGLPDGGHPTVGCIAIAGPVTPGRISLTNMAWQFSRQDLQDALGFDELTFINDYAALSNAVPHLSEKALVKIGGGDPVGDAVKAVVGPGSGLGVSGLLPTVAGPVAIDSEGGHVGFSPFDEVEAQIAGILRTRFGRVSNERLLSGPGIENLYQAIAELRGQPRQDLSASDICERAVSGECRVCCECLDRFCGILGSVAADIALTMGARGGVYIAGGIVPRFIDFFKKSAFRRRFEDKGRFHHYMAAIPTYVITSAYPGLLGAAVVLNQRSLKR